MEHTKQYSEINKKKYYAIQYKVMHSRAIQQDAIQYNAKQHSITISLRNNRMKNN